MKAFVVVSIFFAALSCDTEVPTNDSLDNSSWKVFKTTHEYPDGTLVTFTDDNEGGFYITLKKSKLFEQTWYPYTATETGLWSHSEADKKLTLFDLDNNPVIEYRVVSVTQNGLILFNDNSLVNSDGFVKVTLELRPF